MVNYPSKILVENEQPSREPWIHEKALVDSGVTIGQGTRVWAFAHLVSGAIIGQDCNICDHTFIEGGVVIGNRVTVKSGVYLWDGVSVEDDVFIGPSATFTNDLKPRSKKYLDVYIQTLLKRGASIGANSTILAGTTVGAWSLIGAASVVTKNVPNYAAVWGNPAIFRYWICKCTLPLDFSKSNEADCECGNKYRIVDAEKESIICL